MAACTSSSQDGMDAEFKDFGEPDKDVSGSFFNVKQKAELDSTMNAAFSRSLLAINRNVVLSEQKTQYKEAQE